MRRRHIQVVKPEKTHMKWIKVSTFLKFRKWKFCHSILSRPLKRKGDELYHKLVKNCCCRIHVIRSCLTTFSTWSPISCCTPSSGQNPVTASNNRRRIKLSFKTCASSSPYKRPFTCSNGKSERGYKRRGPESSTEGRQLPRGAWRQGGNLAWI